MTTNAICLVKLDATGANVYVPVDTAAMAGGGGGGPTTIGNWKLDGTSFQSTIKSTATAARQYVFPDVSGDISLLSQSVIPSTDNVLSVGNSAHRYTQIFLSTGISALSALSIDMVGGGTFTLSVGNSGGGVANIGLDGDYFWQSGTAFNGSLVHANTAARVYTFPDVTGNVAVGTPGTTPVAIAGPAGAVYSQLQMQDVLDSIADFRAVLLSYGIIA